MPSPERIRWRLRELTEQRDRVERQAGRVGVHLG
ncbi:hypothetical protein J3R03_001509 [Actinoplanes couchii]|nr:hypothetical protein [Actinoplanes couchii]